MICRTCNIQMRVEDIIRGIYYNLVISKCPKCGKTVRQNIRKAGK